VDPVEAVSPFAERDRSKYIALARRQLRQIEVEEARLTLEDESFFERRPPLLRATKRPEVSETVTLFGYAVDGTSIATTRGAVSRVDFGDYLDAGEGLRLQVNATAWPGNSDGHAVVDGKLTGLVFRRIECTGFVIPN
jgi:hypothetical protein